MTVLRQSRPSKYPTEKRFLGVEELRGPLFFYNSINMSARLCDEGNGFMGIYRELFIWKAGMWSMCAVQSWGRRAGLRNYR